MEERRVPRPKEREDWIGPRQLAREIGIGESKAYELVREGTIRSVRIGRDYRIPRKEIQSFLERELSRSAS